MKRIAALYTCHNRKEKTVRSVSSLLKTIEAASESLCVDIYVTDDGSSDGTSEALRNLVTSIRIIDGDGNLFWSEGMRAAWNAALKEGPYDGYLLLNDDVEIYDTCFQELLEAHNFSLNHLGKPGLYVGATEDRKKGLLTYSGSKVQNYFLYTMSRLQPNGQFQKCDLSNANILLVTNAVVEEIGIFPEGYSHGIADYDYTLTASKRGFPLLLARTYCGHCENDHKDIYEDFAKLSFEERKRIMYSRTGLAFPSYLKYMRKFFPLRFPFVYAAGLLKLYFPKAYFTITGLRNAK